MARYYSNALFIYGSNTDLREFQLSVAGLGSPINFGKFLGWDGSDGLDSYGTGDDWPASYISIADKKYIVDGGDTSWQPAIGVARQVSRFFPRLYFVLHYSSWELSRRGAYKVWNGRELEWRHEVYGWISPEVFDGMLFDGMTDELHTFKTLPDGEEKLKLGELYRHRYKQYLIDEESDKKAKMMEDLADMEMLEYLPLPPFSNYGDPLARCPGIYYATPWFADGTYRRSDTMNLDFSKPQIQDIRPGSILSMLND